MTREEAKTEIMQIYMSLSEEKKQALDVLMAQNCDQCEVGNPCLYCEYEFKAQADNIPVMYYPQVDGITPTVVAQADGEKTCGTCRNEDTYHCAECENKSDYEQAQADGEYISRQAVMDCYKKWQPYMATKLHEFEKELSELPSVAIPNKVGHWENIKESVGIYKYRCDQCGAYHRAMYDYCPSCGSYNGD